MRPVLRVVGIAGAVVFRDEQHDPILRRFQRRDGVLVRYILQIYVALLKQTPRYHINIGSGGI